MRSTSFRCLNRLLMPALFAVALTVFDVGCRKRDIRRTTIQTPAMTNAETAQAIETALSRFAPAVTDIFPDYTNACVSLKYDSMILAKKNLEYTIAQLGFDANEIKAYTNAPTFIAPPR